MKEAKGKKIMDSPASDILVFKDEEDTDRNSTEKDVSLPSWVKEPEAVEAEIVEDGSTHPGSEPEDRFETSADRLVRQGDEALAMLDRAERDFERSMDAFSEGIERLFDVFEGIVESSLKRKG